jgi:hypothetical protein
MFAAELPALPDEPATQPRTQQRIPLKVLVDNFHLPCRVSDAATWQDDDLCGVNCAFGMLLLNGKPCDYNTLKQSAGPMPQGGLSLEEIRQLLARHELETEVVRGSLDDLCVHGAPAIVHVGAAAGAGHFLLCISATSDRIELLDGTTGAILTVGDGSLMDRAAFARDLSGYFVIPRETQTGIVSNTWLGRSMQAIAAAVWVYVLVLVLRGLAGRTSPQQHSKTS